jgi:hypothetical protein
VRFDFLLCSERSGGNLITKMLDAHPEVCGPFPTQILGRESLKRYGYLHALGRVLLVRFEDLLADAEATLRRVCGFLELEYSPAMLEFHRKDLVRTNAGNLSSWNDLGKPLIADNFNLYRSHLGETEIRCVEALCAGEMKALEYTREYDDAVPLADLEAALPPKETAMAASADEAAIYRRFAEATRRIREREIGGARIGDPGRKKGKP